jgi:hypothetical protein
MPAFALPVSFADDELTEARAALSYWEQRARDLPRHAVRRRREARVLAERWSARVSEAEREAYGRGVLGTLLLLAGEGRAPEGVRRTGQRVVRRTRQAVAIGGVACLAVLATMLIVLVELVSALL